MSIKNLFLIAICVLLVFTIVILTGCPETDDENDNVPEYQVWNFPEVGMSPTLVEFAVIGEKIRFLATPPEESKNIDYSYSYEWDAYYDDDTRTSTQNPGYVIETGVTPTTNEKRGGEHGWCTIYFTKAAEWTVALKIKGAPYINGSPDFSKEVILGEYSAIVKVRSVRINPSEIIDGVLGVDYTFTAEIVESALPAGTYTYKWEIDKELGNIWDTSFQTDTNQMTYAFKEGGNYEVIVNVSPGGKELIGKSKVAIADIGLILKTPDESPLVTNKDYTFAAESLNPQYIPENPYYKWDFGDELGLIIPLFNEVTHAFADEGQHTIKVDLCESEADDAPILASATVTLLVEPSANHLIELHQMKKFSLDFAVQHDYVEGMSGVFLWDWDSYGEVIWDGVNCSMEWEQYGHSERMTARVSGDGTVIEQLKIRHEFKSSIGVDWAELEIQNLPFWTDTMPDRFIVDKSGEGVQDYIVFFRTNRTSEYQWTKDARLFVRFEK